MVSGIGIVTYLEKVNYEKKDKSGTVDGVLVHCVVPEDCSNRIVELRNCLCEDMANAFDIASEGDLILAVDKYNIGFIEGMRVCRCWCSNKPNSIVNGLVVGDKVEIRYGKYGEYITRVLPKVEE